MQCVTYQIYLDRKCVCLTVCVCVCVHVCVHVHVCVCISGPKSLKLKIWVFEMSLIREGRTEAYFESCGHARPSHMCVHTAQANRLTHKHNLHFGEKGPPLCVCLITQLMEFCAQEPSKKCCFCGLYTTHNSEVYRHKQRDALNINSQRTQVKIPTPYRKAAIIYSNIWSQRQVNTNRTGKFTGAQQEHNSQFNRCLKCFYAFNEAIWWI